MQFRKLEICMTIPVGVGATRNVVSSQPILRLQAQFMIISFPFKPDWLCGLDNQIFSFASLYSSNLSMSFLPSNKLLILQKNTAHVKKFFFAKEVCALANKFKFLYNFNTLINRDFSRTMDMVSIIFSFLIIGRFQYFDIYFVAGADEIGTVFLFLSFYI